MPRRRYATGSKRDNHSFIIVIELFRRREASNNDALILFRGCKALPSFTFVFLPVLALTPCDLLASAEIHLQLSVMDCRCDPTEIDGHRYNEFIARWARDCVYNAQDITSFAMGWISIVLFLFALLPQIYENFKLKHVEGLSVLFLTLWLVGDVTNLLGCVFTNQLPTVLSNLAIVPAHRVFMSVCCLLAANLDSSGIRGYRSRDLISMALLQPIVSPLVSFT